MFFDDLPTKGLPGGRERRNQWGAGTSSVRRRRPVSLVCDLMKNTMAWVSLGPLLRHESGLELVHEGRMAQFSEMSTLMFPLGLIDRLALGMHAKVLRLRMAAVQIGGRGAANPVVATLERLRHCPDEWEVCAEVIHHTPSGLTLLTRDGLYGFRVAPESLLRFPMGFVARLRLWRVARPLIYRRIAAQVMSAETTFREKCGT